VLQPSVITLDVDPAIDAGPLTLSWHGIGIAAGIAVGAWWALRYARERGLNGEDVLNALVVVVAAGLVGSRLFYLALNDPGALLAPGDWIGSRGFAFYGALLFGTVGVVLYLRRTGLGLEHIDALAAGFPLGMAVGRIGDVISGEHYGPASDQPWAIRYPHPDADVPSSATAYHSGAFYEILVALAMFAIVWPLRRRVRTPGLLLCSVVGLYATGRFVIFFYRDDTDDLAVLNAAQWTSVALVALAGAAAATLRRRPPVDARQG
jgi:phosphatidylglycerol---prolipoprotein diacylglyceryl transferase